MTLRHTVLHGASLHQTNLYKANMADAELDEADLLGVIFEPKAHSLPNAIGLITAKNLATMGFATFPHALEALREVLHQAGMLEQERQVSIAIKRTIQAKIKKRHGEGVCSRSVKIELIQRVDEGGQETALVKFY